MARPAARRKIKNPSLKVSRHTQKKHFRKQKLVAHPIVAEAWDNTKTVKANYEKIGLTLALNSADKAAGATVAGAPGILVTENGKKIPLSDLAATMHNGVVVQSATIHRDANGNVTGYDMPDLDPLEPEFDKVLRAHTQAKLAQSASKTVKDLVALAQSGIVKARLPSSGELDWLHALVSKHGDNYTAMFKDKKLNVYQHTVPQLKGKLKKYFDYLRDLKDIESNPDAAVEMARPPVPSFE
ncbi:Nucleolar protein 16 [Allomyces javanicus]|nr:Nucleolar protein 16 [Allomyces javanicus]